MNRQASAAVDRGADVAAVPWRYTPVQMALHWLLALLLTFMAALGWYMMSIEDDPGSDWYFDLHKSTGIVVALLVAARLAWRAGHRPQPLPASVTRVQRGLAHAVQGALYVLMVLVPVAGYVGASYSKYGVSFFGLPTPAWAVPDHDTAEWFFEIHETLVWVLVGLVALHVLGGLKHLLVDRDGIFARMWPGPR